MSLAVSAPRHARVGTRGLFTVTGQIETSANVGIVILPPRACVWNDAGTSCKVQRLTQCPATYGQAGTLAGRIEENGTDVTPFIAANFANETGYHGNVTFRKRLKALSPGLFHLCAYAQEDEDAPAPLTEAHAFKAFRVKKG